MKSYVSKFLILSGCALSGVALFAQAQVSVRIPGVLVDVGDAQSSTAIAIGSGAQASNQTGIVDEEVQMEGVAVINDDVYIDGVKLGRTIESYKSKKSGIVYKIERKPSGVAVYQE